MFIIKLTRLRYDFVMTEIALTRFQNAANLNNRN